MTNRRVKAVLLAAGLGTRLRPLTLDIPKCLVPINHRPLLDYWFRILERTSIRQVLINTHHMPEQVREYLQRLPKEERWDIIEAYEPNLLGSAGTISQNRSFMDDGDECVIIYADNLSSIDLTELLEFHRSHTEPFTIVLFRTPYPNACGIAELDPTGKVIEFIEKPERPKSDLANAGIYVVTAEVYREIADIRGFDLGFDILPAYIGHMNGFCFDGYHQDIGTLDALDQARRDALEHF